MPSRASRYSAYAPPSQELIGRFKKWEIQGGSIGIWMARLWKRELGAALLLANTETPWDSAPVIGISQALGYGFYRYAEGKWQRYEPRLSKTVYRREHDLLVVTLRGRSPYNRDFQSRVRRVRFPHGLPEA
jgi:hypothetical protein